MNLADYPTPETDKFRDSLDSIRPDGTYRIDAFANFARKIEQQRDHNRRIYETEVRDALFGQKTLKRVINERDKALSENTDTPITDEFERATCDGLESALEHARDLERQLAEARAEIENLEIRHAATMMHGQSVVDDANRLTKERDRLAEALRDIKRFASTKASHSWLQRIATEALATLNQQPS